MLQPKRGSDETRSNAGIVPVEVKAERNLKAKSLAVYRAAHSPALAIRTSLAPHLYSEGLLDLPLPAIGAWRQYARRNGEHVKDENSR